MGLSKQYLALVCARVSACPAPQRVEDDDGDQQAISRALEIVFEVVHRYSGRIAETVGGEVLASFGDAERAGNAVSAMHAAIAALQTGEAPLRLRAGMSFGRVSQDGQGLRGSAIDEASELARCALPGQTLLAPATAEQLSVSTQRCTRKPAELDAQPSGLSRPLELVSSQADAPPASDADEQGPVLTLRHGGHELVLGDERPSAVIGRSPVCDIRSGEQRASRQHVRIERRGPTYYLIDQSSNGTFVRTGDEACYTVSHEALPIEDTLEISLGRSFANEPHEVIRIELSRPFGEA